jgi:[ribosomal protein S5]-alanine N-acetyltransferase
MSNFASPHLTHDLVALRRLTREDAASWHGYLSRPEVMEHTSRNVRSVADLLPIIDSCETDEPTSQIRFVVALRECGTLVGTVGFSAISPVNKLAEIAYDLSAEVWGKGIGTAICSAVTAWGFMQLQLVRIQATTLETNLRSIRVLERSGFEREGYLRSFKMIRGRPGNFWMYSRIADVGCPNLMFDPDADAPVN